MIVSRSRVTLGRATTASCAGGRADATGEFDEVIGVEGVGAIESSITVGVGREEIESVQTFVGAGASVASESESERLRLSWGNDSVLILQFGASILTSSITLFPPIVEGQGSRRNMPCECIEGFGIRWQMVQAFFLLRKRNGRRLRDRRLITEGSKKSINKSGGEYKKEKEGKWGEENNGEGIRGEWGKE